MLYIKFYNNDIENQANDEQMGIVEDANNEQSRQASDPKNGKLEKYFDEILPLIMGFRLVNELIERLHVKCVKAGAPKGIDKTLLFDLEQTITDSYEQVIYIDLLN